MLPHISFKRGRVNLELENVERLAGDCEALVKRRRKLKVGD